MMSVILVSLTCSWCVFSSPPLLWSHKKSNSLGKFYLFQKNANTPLSLLFDHTSALEQMHYQLLKHVMRRHGLGVFLDDPLHGKHVRDILRSSVIFTDMGVHNDFMAQFKNLIESGGG